MQAEVIRSRRKTLCVEIRNGQVIVRAPLRVSGAEISRFLEEKKPWIEKHLARAMAQKEAAKDLPPLTEEDIRSLAEQAKALFPDRVAYFARLMGVTRPDHDPLPADPLGQLQQQGKSEFQLPADACTPGCD